MTKSVMLVEGNDYFGSGFPSVKMFSFEDNATLKDMLKVCVDVDIDVIRKDTGDEDMDDDDIIRDIANNRGDGESIWGLFQLEGTCVSDLLIDYMD